MRALGERLGVPGLGLGEGGGQQQQQQEALVTLQVGWGCWVVNGVCVRCFQSGPLRHITA